MASVDAATALE